MAKVNNFEGGNQAIYLLDFYVGGHHIFKVGMSANPWMRNRQIALSLFENNKTNIDVPLYKFVNDVIHWEFTSVWKNASNGSTIESILLDELKTYSESLYTNNVYGGRNWNKFEGMYEAYPIRSKDVYWVKGKLEKMMDRQIVGNSFYRDKVKYDISFGMDFKQRK